MKMHLKILAHPVFMNLNFHMPMVVDLSHPLIMLTGENGSGKSTLLHSIYYALRGEEITHYSYRVQGDLKVPSVFMFDAEQHNPRNQLELFDGNPQMREFLQIASHGQVMLTMFREAFPGLPDGTMLLLDEPEMALSQSNQRRILMMLKELVDQKNMRVVAATHSPILLESITFRTMVLRDLSGVVHVFPNGSITTLANQTKGWSAYVLNLGIAYDQDTDAVVQTMKDVHEELMKDPDYGPKLLAPIEVFGVDDFGDSSVVIKARLRTLPVQQWVVGREYRRRLKQEMDKRGIEIPFPQRTLHFAGQPPMAPAA